MLFKYVWYDSPFGSQLYKLWKWFGSNILPKDEERLEKQKIGCDIDGAQAYLIQTNQYIATLI